jgi:glycosyltransferase involved in cell wall biosynthesis
MICYLFPPVAGSGVPAVKRALKFLQGFVDRNWEPVVLTIDPEYYEPYLPLDPKFLDAVPVDVKVERTGRVRMFRRLVDGINACRKWFRGTRSLTSGATDTPGSQTVVVEKRTNMAGRLRDALGHAVRTPDPHIGWLPHAFWRGRAVIRQQSIDCIYATGFPWSSLVVAAMLKRVTGTPLVVDFRDPWATNPSASIPAWRKKVEERLERFVVNSADVVIANTQALCDEFRQRYGATARPRFETVYNMLDDATSIAPAHGGLRAGRARLVHAGFLYGNRDPHTFLEAVAAWRRNCPDDQRGILELVFVGSADLPYSLHGLVADLGIDDMTTLMESMPHRACMDLMADASGLLLLQPGTMTQLPSKVFEYVSLGKPIVTVADRGSETYQFAAQRLQTFVAAADDVSEISNMLTNFVGSVMSGFEPDTARWSMLLREFTMPVTMSRVVGLLDDLVAPGAAVGPARSEEAL